MDLRKLMQALSCAIAVLDDTAGGYTPAEKADAKLALLEALLIVRLMVAKTTT